MQIVETDGSAATPTTGELVDFVARAAADLAIGTVAEAHGCEPEMCGSPDPNAPTVQVPPPAEPSQPMPSIGRIVWAGTPSMPDAPAPAIITRVHSPTCVNLWIFEDDNGIRFQPSAELGEHWAWPARV